jgi:hypothetical protein
VDFSDHLLQIAKNDHSADNIAYHRLDVVDDNWNDVLGDQKFSKILMFAALQHIKTSHLTSILKRISMASTDDKIILFGFVPDREKKWHFYNTPKRKLIYCLRVLSKNDPLGTWWSRTFLERKSSALGMRCTFSEVPKNLHANLYRFNAKLE